MDKNFAQTQIILHDRSILQNNFSVKITIWGSVIINMGQKIVG